MRERLNTQGMKISNEPYKILLVDDEAEVRTSIIRKIDWSAVGFQVVGDAENGVDALEKIEQLEPDVVLTDIRMPYMDGLEMAERLREIHPSIKVVLFSGFDDFEYAQKAIKLNIIEYILKPVNAEEMMEILLRIKGTLDEEIQRLRDLTNLQESFRKNLPILREKFLSNLVKGNVGKEDIPVLMGGIWSFPFGRKSLGSSKGYGTGNGQCRLEQLEPVGCICTAFAGGQIQGLWQL